MGSVADIVKDDSTDMPTSMTSFTGILPPQRSCHVWNRQAFCDLLGNGLWHDSSALEMWPATCMGFHLPEYICTTYKRQASNAAGKIAAAAEESKAGKYAHLDQVYLFNPVAIETSGALEPHTAAFLNELGSGFTRRKERQCRLPIYYSTCQ